MRRLSSRVARIVLVLSFIAVCLCDISSAQGVTNETNSTARLGIQGTAGVSSYREDLLVPLSFDGPRFSLGAVYANRTSDQRINSRLKIGAGFLKNRYSHSAYALELGLRSSWLARVSSSPELGTFWLGASLPLEMNNVFFDSWDDAHLYWVTAYMLGVAAAWEYGLFGEYSAMVHVEIPLLGLVSRPGEYRYTKQEALNQWTFHFSEPNRNLRFASLGAYRAIFVQTLLTPGPDSNALVLGIEFEYGYCARPSPFQLMHTSIVASYQWGL